MTLMQYGKLHQRELITHVVPVTEAPGMYEKMKVNDPSVLGVVFDWRQ
jgi:threonine dehydrogenase-like Zn-dependent dehydrogenase